MQVKGWTAKGGVARQERSRQGKAEDGYERQCKARER